MRNILKQIETGAVCDKPGLVTGDYCIVMVWADPEDDTNQPSAFLDDV
ncbi:MAG: hypothetical protein NTY46_01680 [Candidatus Sumerlaeota bacterium]|nr:hypothetical protein [Candidatus Sumerlaeota bacterium]